MQTSKTTGPFVRRSFPRLTIPPRFRPVSVNGPKTIEFLKKKTRRYQPYAFHNKGCLSFYA